MPVSFSLALAHYSYERVAGFGRLARRAERPVVGQRAAVRVSVRHQDRFLFLRGTVADSGIKRLGNSIDENQHVST